MKLNEVQVWARLAGAAMLALAAAPALADDYQNAVVAQNPVGYWRLDESLAPPVPPIYAANLGSLAATGHGLYVDEVTNHVVRGQPGALFDSPDTSCRFSNPGWDILFVGSHIDVSNNAALNPNGPFSVELWAKPSSVAPDDFSPLCSLDPTQGTNNLSREGYIIYYEGTNSGWNFRLGGTNGYVAGVAGGVAGPGQWSHVVGTYNGSSISLYVNGALVGTAAVPSAQFLPNTNATEPFRIGATTIPSRTFDGWVDEVAFYGSALSASTIQAHYNIGSTNGTAYPAAVQAATPVGYWRLDEPGAPAANLGTLGTPANGTYVYDALPGQPGPSAPTFPGFVTGNKAVGFNGLNNGYVTIPALNLFTNTVTITAWVWASTNLELSRAGLVVNRSGSGADATAAGLTMDIEAGLGLSYNWENNPTAYEWDSFLQLSPGVWNFVGLVIQPTETDLYVVDSTNVADFVGSTNYLAQGIQAFAGDTLIGTDPGASNFDGYIAQVAIFNRSLGAGDVFTEYAAAVGQQGPTIFAMPTVTPSTPFQGDSLTLGIDAGGTPPLSYQWYFGATPIPGGTNSVLTTLATNTGSFTYNVTVTNRYGATNGAVTIDVSAASMPVVAQGPVSRTLYPGATLTMNVAASGGDLIYYWQHAGTNLPGVTGPTYQVASITTNVAGQYAGVVSNRVGTAPFGPANISVPSPAAGSYEAAVVADAPEAWWRLDEPPGSPNMWDSMGRHDGTYTNGGPNPVTLGVPGALYGDPDTAVMFDGTSASYGVVPYSGAINPGIATIECWVKAGTNTQADSAAVSSQFALQGWWIAPLPVTAPEDATGWTFFSDFAGKSYYTPDQNSEADGAINQGWTHVVVVYSPDNGISLYVNGLTDGFGYGPSAGGGPFDFNGAGPLLIGALGENSGVAPDQFFAGEVDEVAVYPTYLSAARIEAHYQSRYGLNTAPLFQAPIFSQTVGAGTEVSFSTVVAGTAPMSLQWNKNGAAISGATNSTLTLTNTALSDTATYQLVATNTAGKTNMAASLVVLPPPKFANVTNNLLLHLTFDFTLNDVTGNGNDGTVEGAGLEYVPGKIGTGALGYFTDTDANGTVTNAQYVSLGTNADLQLGGAWTNGTSFSVAFWVKLPAGYVGADLPFLGNATNSSDNFGFTFCPGYGTGGWKWSLNDSITNFDALGPNDSINDANWHHLAFTFDHPSATASTYEDGQLVHVDSIAGLGNFDSGQPVTIGQDPTGLYSVPSLGAVADSADIDDLAIWQTTLTPLQICTIYGAGVNAKASFETVGHPTLGVLKSGHNLTLLWQGGTLLQASSLSGPWTPVSAATPPTATITPGPGKAFYRIEM